VGHYGQRVDAATPGKGSAFVIHYNPAATGKDEISVGDDKVVPAIKNADGTTGRPGEIGMIHEFVHGDHINHGTYDPTQTRARDPDSAQRGQMTKEEINTRNKESMIRKERNVVERESVSN
jgi:hypothetical protein